MQYDVENGHSEGEIPMICSVYTAGLSGITGSKVTVEC